MPLLYTWKKAVRKKAKLGIEQQIASACSTISAEPHACYEHTARLAEKPPGKDARAIHRRCVARFFRSRNPPLSKMFHMRYFGSRRRPIIHPDTCEPFGFARRKEPARRRLSDSALELARIMRILLRSLRQRPSAFTFELALFAAYSPVLRSHRPVLPPSFLSRRTSMISMPRSTALHMS